MRIAASVPRDVADAVRSVWGPLERYAHPALVDLAARRLANASEAVNGADVPTLDQVRALIAAVDVTTTTTTAGSGIRIGTFAQRGTAQVRGSLFAASDRNYVVWGSDGSSWRYLAGVQSGTLDPDMKPTLTTADAGYLFASTDFDRVYRWSGSAWADAPGQPTRGMIVYFEDDLLPGAWWALCDGSTVDRSTTTGGTNSLTLPDLTTDNRFLRSVAGATAGTGGAATVNPPSTDSGSNSATQEVQSGTGVTVAAEPHIHAVDLAALATVPPYFDARPYMRL